jgi:hypothetical protein
MQAIKLKPKKIVKQQDKSPSQELDGYTTVTGCTPIISAMDREYLNSKNSQRRAEKLNQIAQTTDLVVSIAKEAGWLDWMSLRHSGDNTSAGKLSSWLDQYLNEDSWKQSICSPLLIKDSSSVSDGGSIVQCEDNLCEPVFTQAIQKLHYNKTHYMYVLTYYIGGVKFPEMSSDDAVVSYQAYLKSSSMSVPLFVDPKTKKPTHVVLKNGEYVDFKEVLPLTENNYDEICFVFDTPFPPHEPNAVTEICRKIYDSAERDNLAWDTGSPTKAEEYQLPSLNKDESDKGTTLDHLMNII